MEDKLTDLKQRLERLAARVDLEGLRARIAALEKEMSRPGFWDDRNAAQAKARELEAAKAKLAEFSQLQEALEEAEILWQLAEEEGDEAARAEVEGLMKEACRTLEPLLREPPVPPLVVRREQGEAPST